MSKPAFDPSKPFTPIGSKPEFDPSQPFQAVDKTPSLASDAGTLVSRDLLFGTRPFVAGVGGAIGEGIGQLERNDIGLAERLKNLPSAMGQAFVDERKNAQVEEAGAAERHPGLSVGSAVGTTLATLPLFAIKALQAPKAAEGASVLARLANGTGQAAKVGAGFGAAQALGNANSVKEAVQDIGAGAGGGVVVQGAINSLPYVAKGSGWLAKKGITALFGPGQEAIDRYLQRADAVKSAKSIEEIKNSLDQTMQGLFDDVDKSRLTKDEAKQALDLINNKIRDTASQANFQFNIKNADVKDMLKNATQKFEAALKGKTEELSAIKSPIQLADDVATSINELKKQVTQGSTEAYDILAKSKGKVNLSKPFGQLESVKQQLSIAGNGPITAEAKNVYNSISALQQNVGLLPAEMPLVEAKKLIQQLDSTIDYGNRAGIFTNEMNQALTGLRRGIDEQLKHIKPYAAKMKEVADKAQLLSKASERFGDSRAAVSRLNSISSRTAGEDQQILNELGKATSRDFTTPVKNFTQAQAVLKDPSAMEKIKRGLPEYKEMRLQQITSAGQTRPEARPAFVQGELAKLGLPQEQASAEQGLASAIQKLKQSEENLAPYKQLSPLNTQSAINGLMKNPGKESIELRRTMEELSKMSGKDFMNWIQDRRTANAFKGQFKNGSRNINLWALMGGVTGGVPGAAVGGAVGSMVDTFGPQIAQKILDGALKIGANPTVQRIQALAIPPQAKAFMIKELNELGSASPAIQEPSSAISRRIKKLGGE